LPVGAIFVDVTSVDPTDAKQAVAPMHADLWRRCIRLRWRSRLRSAPHWTSTGQCTLAAR